MACGGCAKRRAERQAQREARLAEKAAAREKAATQTQTVRYARVSPQGK